MLQDSCGVNVGVRYESWVVGCGVKVKAWKQWYGKNNVESNGVMVEV